MIVKRRFLCQRGTYVSVESLPLKSGDRKMLTGEAFSFSSQHYF